MSTATDHFERELERLITRTRKEYDLTYAEAIGTLMLVVHRLQVEADR